MEQNQPIRKPITQLKELTLKDKSFEANGKTYVVHESISIDRWMKLEKMGPEITYGYTFDNFFKLLKDLWGHIQRMEFGMASVLLYNMMNGVKNVTDDKLHIALKQCCLFMNVEGEDLADITDAQMRVKIADWKLEGISINSFFLFAINFIPGFIAAYKESSQDSFLKNPPQNPGDEPLKKSSNT